MENKLTDTSSNQDKELVVAFLFRTDIVYTAPGMQDEITIWENGIRKRVRKYYLTMHLKEAYALFKAENQDLKIGYSKFCSFRPQNVLLMKDTPCDQCKCKIHENFILLLKGLRITYNNDFWEKVLCNSDLNSDCWKMNCIKCSSGQLLKEFLEEKEMNDSISVEWHEWVMSENSRLYKKTHEGCIGELTELVQSNFKSFQQHVHIKRIQAAAFQSDIQQKDTIVLQVDFAMNYSCEWQAEIQSALWSRQSVTLFTAAVFEKQKTKCYLIVSDTKDKSKQTVSAFITKLIEHIEFESIKPKLVVWSDGPSSEFKNKFICYFIHILSNTWKRFSSIEWKYSATSHGKGVVDGVGGSAKSHVYAEVMARRAIVQDADSFAKVAARVMQNVKVISVMQQEIDQVQITWDLAKGVSGIKKAHVIKCCNKHVYLFTSAQSLDTPIQQVCYATDICHDCESRSSSLPSTSVYEQNADMKPGTFLLVKVWGKKSWKPYVAQVSTIENDDLSVVFLKKQTETNFTYPENDVAYIQQCDIIKKLPVPTINNRGIVVFPHSVI